MNNLIGGSKRQQTNSGGSLEDEMRPTTAPNATESIGLANVKRNNSSKKKLVINNQQSLNERKNRAHLANAAEGNQ
jgi:hypothetical protein